MLAPALFGDMLVELRESQEPISNESRLMHPISVRALPTRTLLWIKVISLLMIRGTVFFTPLLLAGRGIRMQKASEYHQRAEECRLLAARTRDPEHKVLLAEMAETWETLARQREALLARKMRIAALEMPKDEPSSAP
ncbi:MAG TPA: hypothetical protein VL199_15790 [Burkholderiales bacterium]|nr:hypothetical protein [Burkholderiales bacterium]